MDKEERERLIVSHIPLARKMARKIISQLPKNVVEDDDIISQAMLGLVYAAETFDNTRGTRFACFAVRRVQGCIKDYLRSLDHLPKEERRKSKRHIRNIDKLSRSLNRKANPEEVEELLGITVQEQNDMYSKLSPTVIICISKSLSENYSKQEELNPEEIYFQKIDNQIIRGLIESFDFKKKLIVALYFGKGIQMKKIGEIFNVTEARISQIIHECANIFTKGIEELNIDETEKIDEIPVDSV